MKMIRSNKKGISLIELIFTMAILSVLASVILPSAQLIAKRNKEIELRRNLRTIRTAIDDYHRKYQETVGKRNPAGMSTADPKSTGYPESLDVLVDGSFDFGDVAQNATKPKFLRRIPFDPFNPPKPGEKPKWALRGYADEPDATFDPNEEKPKGGVFDVMSLSEETAIDGTKYKDW